MVKKLTLLAGFGAGYVLGTRAGRERYEQIAATVGRVRRDPRVQEKVDQAAQVAKEKAAEAQEVVKDKVSDLGGDDAPQPGSFGSGPGAGEPASAGAVQHGGGTP